MTRSTAWAKAFSSSLGGTAGTLLNLVIQQDETANYFGQTIVVPHPFRIHKALANTRLNFASPLVMAFGSAPITPSIVTSSPAPIQLRSGDPGQACMRQAAQAPHVQANCGLAAQFDAGLARLRDSGELARIMAGEVPGRVPVERQQRPIEAGEHGSVSWWIAGLILLGLLFCIGARWARSPEG